MPRSPSLRLPHALPRSRRALSFWSCVVGIASFATLGVACEEESSSNGRRSTTTNPDGANGSDGDDGDGGSPDGGDVLDGGTGPVGDAAAEDAATRPPRKTDPKPLTSGEGFYPRVVRRSNGTIVASVIRFLGESQRMGAEFFASADEGLSFTHLGLLDDARNDGGLCCGTLYEVPRALGDLAAGTLLFAASSGGDAPDAPMRIPVWKSTDGGASWSFVSNALTAGKTRKNGGLWEPEFSMLEDGSLVCHVSDETDGAHSQKLIEVKSQDGVTWGAAKDTVAPTTWDLRPGMPVVRRPPGQDFVLSYEICGLGSAHCAAFVRTSSDGWNWGPETALGTRVFTMDGQHFRHAPTLAWAEAPGSAGRFYMVGQMVYDTNGAVAASNGRILLANTQGATGNWFPIAAPVAVPNAEDNFCPNYSSPILPLEGGTVALELASRWDGDTCRTYFARAPLTDVSDGAEVKDGAAFSLASVISGLCLDVENGSANAGANVQQFTCNGSNAQKWTVLRDPSGTVRLRSGVGTELCLTREGSGTTPGANVNQQPCNGGAAQAWTLRGVGLDHYELRAEGAPVCLDVAQASTSNGGNVAIWTCNDLSPQIWRFTAR